MKKKILFSAVLFFCVFAVASVLKTKAGTAENVSGWSWGGSEEAQDNLANGNETGVGWVSANSLNCDTNADGASDGAAGCPPAGTPMADYGINIPNDGSPASGYAWSENIGWISFNPADLAGCPSGECNAKRVGNDLVGWARIMAIPQAGINAGGWTGFVKLSGTLQDLVTPYGVKIDPVTGHFDGFAWSGGELTPELGAIRMKGDNYVTRVTPPPSIGLSANPLTFNVDTGLTLPQATTLSWSVSNASSCTASSSDGNAWSGSKSNTTGTEAVNVTVAPTTYTLNCVGPGGSSSANVMVTTVCYEHTCGTGTCNANPRFNVANSAACAGVQNCANDTQCEGRSTGTWKEVAP